MKPLKMQWFLTKPLLRVTYKNKENKSFPVLKKARFWKVQLKTSPILEHSWIWVVSMAVGVTLPPSGALLIMALLVVGVAVPTPGAVGGFHEAYRVAATAFFGADNDHAVGAAIVLHAVGFVPTLIVGAWLMAREGLSFTHLGAEAKRAKDEETRQ